MSGTADKTDLTDKKDLSGTWIYGIQGLTGFVVSGSVILLIY
jgi:hypothetical protein